MKKGKLHAEQMEKKLIAVQSENDNLIIKKQKLSILTKDVCDQLFMLSDEIETFHRLQFKTLRKRA